MSSAFKISEAAAIALHAASLLAEYRNSLLNAAEIAKVLQALTRAGIVTTERGRRGGYRLLRPPETITLLKVYETIEGRMRIESCLFRRKACKRSSCILRGLIEEINNRTMHYFHETTLADLVGKIRQTVSDEKEKKQ